VTHPYAFANLAIRSSTAPPATWLTGSPTPTRWVRLDHTTWTELAGVEDWLDAAGPAEREHAAR
jgi:hypothetical protein